MSEPTGPKLTLYVRNPSKLPTAHSEADPSRIRVVKGGLNDQAALEDALTDWVIPVDTVISFLGAYPSLSAFLLRTKATPIADSFPTIFAAMKTAGVKRILALSTPAWQVKGDSKSRDKKYDDESTKSDILPWSWWIMMKFVVPFTMPQGNEEMLQIARRVTEEPQRGGWGLQWTVFRVPHLNGGGAEEKVSAGLFGHGFMGTQELSRKSLVKWVREKLRLENG